MQEIVQVITKNDDVAYSRFDFGISKTFGIWKVFSKRTHKVHGK